MKLELKKINIFEFLGKQTLIYLMIGFFASLFLGFIELLIALFIQLFFVNLGLINEEIKFAGYILPKFSLELTLGFLFLIGFFRFFMQIISSQSANYASERFCCRFKNMSVYDLLYKTSKEPGGVSEFFYHFMEIIPKAGNMVNVTIVIFSVLIQSISFFGIMIFTAWKESLLSLFGILFIGIFVITISKYIKSISVLIPKESMNLSMRIQRVSRNLLFFEIMKTKENEHRNLENTVINLSNYVLRTSILTSISTSVAPLLGVVLIIIIVFVSRSLWNTSSLILISFLYLLMRFVQNLSNLSNQFASAQAYFQQYLIAIKYFSEFSPEVRAKATDSVKMLNYFGAAKPFSTKDFANKSIKDNNILLSKFQYPPSILVENIDFKYPNSKEKLFSNLTFQLESGKQLGIIGASGSGKSTLLLLLLGVIKPITGNILIDDIDPENFFINTSNRVGYVGAEPYLIKGSIKENLIYGVKNKVTEKEISEALEFAQLDSFVKKIGLEYIILEDQSGLSAGQKQRLCLARAILNKPKLLVLDEATANLDETTEAEISLLIKGLKDKCTVLIVSHRPGILKEADQILKLDQLA